MTQPLRLFREDIYAVLPRLGWYDMLFADPPDNIGLPYHDFVDIMPDDQYVARFDTFLNEAVCHAPIVWVSFNEEGGRSSGERRTISGEGRGGRVRASVGGGNPFGLPTYSLGGQKVAGA